MKPLSTVQLAKVLGVARATIYRWLREGHISPSIEHGIKRIAGKIVFQPMAWTGQDVQRIRKWMDENYRPDKAKGGRK